MPTIPSPKTLMLADLARSGLDPADADALHMVAYSATDTARAAGLANAAGRSSYRIPYFDVDGKPTDFYRLRLLPGEGGPKYVGPAGVVPGVYLPPLMERRWRDLLADPGTDLILGEGEKKAACACKHGFPTIGLGGVDSFSAKKHGLDFLPTLEAVEWDGRRVTIIYDADIVSKPRVQAALLRLAAELLIRGANVHVGYLAADGAKGIDDLIVTEGPEALREVLVAAKPLREGEWPLDTPVPARMFPHRKPAAKGPGAPLPTIECVQTLLNVYGITVCYDVMKKTPVYKGRGVALAGGADVQHGAADQALNRIYSLARLCGMGTDDLDKTITGIAYSCPSNPVLDFLKTLRAPSRGEPDAILALARKFDVARHEMATRDGVFRLWMVQACAAADYARQTPNRTARPTFEYVLTLLGAQGVLKTSTIRSIVPRELRDYVVTGVSLNPDDKDSVARATGGWVVELGEIDATFRKADHARMKAFLSSHEDIYRVPYGRARNSWPRQTVYVATGNVVRSLRDITGSRRYWPLNVLGVASLSDGEVQRAWAQAWHLYLAGAQWWPTAELQRELDARANTYSEEFPLGEKVLEVFGPLTPEAKAARGCEWLTASRIMEAVGTTFDPKRRDDAAAARELGLWLARFNLDKAGRPDRRERSNTNEWRMPKRGPTPAPRF